MKEQILLAIDLEAIRDKMVDMLGKAEDIMAQIGGAEEARAQSYWIGHMKAALGVGGYHSMHSVQDTLKELYEEEEVLEE